MPAAVIFPDVELWATGFLRDALAARPEPYAAATVDIKVPPRRADRMVIVRRDGGPRIDETRETARLGIRVWGRTEQEATNLALLVRALLWASPDGNPVVRASELSGPMPIADESGQPLRYMTFELTVRGTNLT